MPKKRYDQVFKREVLAYLASSGENQEEVARRFGISSGSLRYWQSRTEASLGAPQSGTAPESASVELRRLRRENQRLQMQCEILKKTVVIFSNPSGNVSERSEP